MYPNHIVLNTFRVSTTRNNYFSVVVYLRWDKLSFQLWYAIGCPSWTITAPSCRLFSSVCRMIFHFFGKIASYFLPVVCLLLKAISQDSFRSIFLFFRCQLILSMVRVCGYVFVMNHNSTVPYPKNYLLTLLSLVELSLV